ncbi:hypothetical protein Vpar_1158 [Veillonella parvula DSM 2008]|uniref:hypothetical protein n=1 Tax=Veillonella parvula TaxID=29466 RepID=UPI00019BFBE0|nr:hypothetical protein [Veillonella parvula]ACZ24839.1 hypothetical protein Vpar_1158 [Veillonella parvula DSM 2008]QQB17690.1 hypothetical protein I6I03_03305 [Veillonella parvula]SNU98812.1 Uncharacterised protein [Veillonella parvula]
MKRCITLLSLGLCLAAPMLSNANDIRPLIHVTNVHNGQYDEGLDAITEIKFFGPYQFRVLKDSVETKGETKDIDGRAFRTSDGVFMHVKARSIDNTSISLDKEIKKIVKDRTVPEPTVKMVLPIKYDVTEIDNDGVRSLLAEFMYGWPLHNRTDMVLVTDYEDTRYYYNLQFYRDQLPKGVRIEQLRQMIMDAQFSYK